MHNLHTALDMMVLSSTSDIIKKFSSPKVVFVIVYVLHDGFIKGRYLSDTYLNPESSVD